MHRLALRADLIRQFSLPRSPCSPADSIPGSVFGVSASDLGYRSTLQLAVVPPMLLCPIFAHPNIPPAPPWSKCSHVTFMSELEAHNNKSTGAVLSSPPAAAALSLPLSLSLSLSLLSPSSSSLPPPHSSSSRPPDLLPSLLWSCFWQDSCAFFGQDSY